MLYTPAATRLANRRLGRSILAAPMLRDLARRLAEWRLCRNTALQLNDLDDHLLADIGIPRHAIGTHVRRALNRQ